MKDSAFESFSELAQDALDFARCQRPDGSFYGTGGQCRKGALVDPREKKEKKAKKLDSEEVKNLLGGKLNNNIDNAMAAVDLMDGVAIEEFDKMYPEDAKRIEKYDKMFYDSESPLNKAVSDAEAKVEALNTLHEMAHKHNTLTTKVDEVLDKNGPSPQLNKAIDKKLDLVEEMEAKAAKVDSKTSELIAKKDEANAAWLKQDPGPKSDKAYDKYRALKDKVESRVEDLAFDTKVSRKLDKQLNEKLARLEGVKDSVRQRQYDLEIRRNDRMGDMTWADMRAIYSVARGGPLTSEQGKYSSDLKSWTNSTYKQMRAAGYKVTKSGIKEAIEDTLLSPDWGDSPSSRTEYFYDSLANLT